MGEYDFYGNELTDVHNIGCYDGAGESEKPVKNIFKCLYNRMNTLLGFIYTAILNISDRYWLF